MPRPRRLAAIDAAGPVRVVAVVAPAGYGKSTLLAQWAATKDPDSVRASLGEILAGRGVHTAARVQDARLTHSG